MTACENFIYAQEPLQQRIMLVLHHVFTTYPNIIDKIHYRIPFYFQYSPICYLNPRPKGVELVFVQGQQLSNEQKILENRGRKQVAGVFMDDPKKIATEAIVAVFEEALLLDEQLKKKKPANKKEL